MADTKVDSYMPLHIGDYLADTTDLTTEEHGAYLLILMALWRAREPLPLNRLRPIAKVSASRWALVWAVIARFFDIDTGELVSQGRVNRQIADAMARKRRASDRGALGAAARWSKQVTVDAHGIEQASPKQPIGTDEAIPAPFPFMNQSEGSVSKQNPSPDPSRQSDQVTPARSQRRAIEELAPNWERYKMPFDVTEGFRGVFGRYPNQNGQARAASAWCAIVEAGFDGGEEALRAAILARFDAGQLAQHPYTGDARYRPTFETYLKEFRWLEADSAPSDLTPVKAAETLEQRNERGRREGADAHARRMAEIQRAAREAEVAAKEKITARGAG